MISKQGKSEFIEVEKKNNNVFYIILVLLFIIGFGIGFFILSTKTSKITESVEVITPAIVGSSDEITDIVNNPPLMAVKGNLIVDKDLVEIMQRGTDFWIDAASVSAVLQEESIKTDDNGKAVISFSEIVSLKINSLSLLNLLNLIPDSFLIEQESGDVRYLVKKPISVKYKDSLASLRPGIFDMTVDPDDGFVYLNVASGSAKFAFINNNNETEVHDVNKGDEVIYNPKNTTIDIQ